MRVFIAVELGNECINEIAKIQKLLRKKVLFYGKFTESMNLHLTLKFLGEIDDKKVEEIKKKLSEIKINEFEVELGEVGVFSPDFVKIIWIKLNGSEIFRLQKTVDDALKGLFKPEERFMSHVTIARVKKVGDKKGLIEYLRSIKPRKIKFKVDNFILKKSELLPEGPIYEDLSVFKLKSNSY
jgi:2'-5' RNA ligase